MKDLETRLKQKTTELEYDIRVLKGRLKKSEDLMKTTELGHFGSCLQIYIGSTKLQTEVKKEIISLEDLVNSQSLKQHRLDLRFEKEYKDKFIIESDKLFGRILDEFYFVPFKLKSELDKQAPIMSIDDVKLTLMSTFGNPITRSCYHKEICGCSVILPGRICLANYGGSSIIIRKNHGWVEKEMPISQNPRDITVIDKFSMAVSCEEGVKIISITNGLTKKTIATGSCYGLEYYNGSLICAILGKGVISVDLTNNNMTTLVHDTRQTGSVFCTAYRDKIYVSSDKYDTITCYSITGYKLWEYQDTSVISDPFGIAVDNSCNVYVALLKSHRVVVLSPDGKRSRILLTEKDGLCRTSALHFKRSNNQLIVVNESGKVFLFQLYMSLW